MKTRIFITEAERLIEKGIIKSLPEKDNGKFNAFIPVIKGKRYPRYHICGRRHGVWFYCHIHIDKKKHKTLKSQNQKTKLLLGFNEIINKGL